MGKLATVVVLTTKPPSSIGGGSSREIPELLADHVVREAEHFLKLLGEHKQLIEKNKLQGTR